MLHNLDIANATLDEIRKAAYQRGHDIATWQDTPELGAKLDPSVDWIGVDRIEDTDDQREALSVIASEAEENERQFSPNEVWIAAVNARDDSEEAWGVIDEAIAEGIRDEIAARNLVVYHVYADYGYQSESEIGKFSNLSEAQDLADAEADADVIDEEEEAIDHDDEPRKIEVVTFASNGEVNTEYLA